jgi:YesN/AraC family two-component response regulator
MDQNRDADTRQLEKSCATAQEIRCATALQLIAQLYHVQFIELTDRKVIDEVCEKYRLHPIQSYFNENVLDLTRQSIDEDTAYHIVGAFLVHFILFSVSGVPYLFGPFCTDVLSKTDANCILRQCSVQDLDPKHFLTYHGSLPLIKEIDAYKIVSTFIHTVNPEEADKDIRKISSENNPLYDDASDKSHRANHSALLEQRYAHEKKFMEDIISGNTRSAISNLKMLERDVSYLIRIDNTALEYEKIGAAITRTTVRLAAIQAGLPAYIIDKFSTENTLEIIRVKTSEEVHAAKETLVRNICKAIREIKENKFSARVQSTMYCLNHSYQNPISMSELSEDLNVSENRLVASFKKEVGITPNAYLTKIRMQHAAHLLISGNMSVNDVSIAVGISDANYFVKLFKKIYGETPTVYRNRHTT